jgi:hypothetical protein
VDKKARDILFKTYWTSAGWTNDENRKTDPGDFEFAKSKGLMFDPISITKDELISRLDTILKNISLKKITDAFLCSLTNKRLDWRSGLASYANGKRLLSDKTVPDRFYNFGNNEDLNVLNFERIKWGGVRHSQGLYNLLDLELLSAEIIPPPANQDLELFNKILSTIENSQTGDTPGKLRDNLKEVFQGSKDERHVLMEILGCAGILQPLRYDRKEPGKHDWTFVLHWRGEDKYNVENVKYYFGKYSIDKKNGR